jgi:hypothetical protein
VDAKSAFTKTDDLKHQTISCDGKPYNGRLLREHFPGSVHSPKSSLGEAVKSVCVGEAQAAFADHIAVFSLFTSSRYYFSDTHVLMNSLKANEKTGQEPHSMRPWLQLLYILKSRPLMHPRNAATYPAATLCSELRRALVPKGAESMRREGKPLLDFKQQITQHRRNHNASFTQTTGIR